MVLQGPLTNEHLRSSHPLSELVFNGNPFPEIRQTSESDSLVGRTRIGSPIQKVIPYSNNRGNHHTEFAASDALKFPQPGAGLVLVSHYEDPLQKTITVEYYTPTPDEAIEYFI